MKSPCILVDMDCVLVDFVSGALKAHHVSFADVEPHWPIGTYGMTAPIGAVRNPGKFTDRDFWTGIEKVEGFWDHLAPLPWYIKLYQLVSSLTDDWWVVTSPSLCETCIPGKRRWLRKYLGKDGFHLCVPTAHKHLMANPNTILIDDCDANVVKFKEHGGQGIVFPAYHNTRYEYRNDPMAMVERSLQRIKETM